MEFSPTTLAGAWLIHLHPRRDERGFFVRTYCEQQFSQQGLNTRWSQTNCSYSASTGTLRGMHYQRGVNQEIKLVRCLRGSVLDAILDLRASSPTRHRSLCVQLTADGLSLLYVPRGCAHGFLTLTPDVEMEYMVSEPYAPGAEAGIRYDDPYFKLPWPNSVRVISQKDASWPDFDPASPDSNL